MAPHSSTLAWKIPWMEEPGRLQSMGLQRVGHNWATSLSLFTFLHWRRKWQPTPIFLPGESQGAWWAAVYGVTQSWTRLTWLSSSSSYQIQWLLLFFCLIRLSLMFSTADHPFLCASVTPYFLDFLFASLSTHSLFLNLFYWSMVDLQCFVNFCCEAQWFSYTYISILFHIPFCYGLLHDTDYSSLCYTIGPCYLFILYIVVCTC